ncbi:hypothetical protein JST97_02280 [bacterium]|nr:hypothetical protein [bacterium]
MAGGDAWVALSLQTHLQDWGWRLVFHFSNSGLIFRRYSQLDFENRFGTWNRRSRSHGKGGLYQPKTHEIAVPQTSWRAAILHHELGHVLDRMLSAHKASISTNFWHGFAPTRQGFLSDYAASHPQEYLAVCIEAFLSYPSQALWLERNDPGMHAFLTALFELSGEDW